MKKYSIVSTVPFGYRLNKSQGYNIQEVEAKVVREVYRLFLKYQSIKKVGNQINSSSFIYKRKFNLIKIKHILENYVYTGALIYNKYPVENINLDNKILVQNIHEEIIPIEDWIKVQSVLSKKFSKSLG
ncbi:recombinase family protein [Robertmurraya sp. GLU-23]